MLETWISVILSEAGSVITRSEFVETHMHTAWRGYRILRAHRRSSFHRHLTKLPMLVTSENQFHRVDSGSLNDLYDANFSSRFQDVEIGCDVDLMDTAVVKHIWTRDTTQVDDDVTGRRRFAQKSLKRSMVRQIKDLKRGWLRRVGMVEGKGTMSMVATVPPWERT